MSTPFNFPKLRILGLRSITVVIFLAITLVSSLSSHRVVAQPSELIWDQQIYAGIEQGTKDAIQILRIDLTEPEVRFETVLAQGYDRDGNFGECRDVNTPGNSFGGPGCQNLPPGSGTEKYPVESVEEMATRLGAVAGFNADFFDHINHGHGPQGLTVKNGDRFDGPCYGDDDGGAYSGRKNHHLAISKDGEIQIDIAGTEAPDDCNINNEPFVTDPDKYWNTVGAGPLLVEQGISVVERECNTLNRYCPDRFTPRARTAVGTTADGKLIVAVLPESAGAILDDSQNAEAEDLSELMISLRAFEAINLDGGGSSQLWYNGGYLVEPERKVADGVLVFSEKLPPSLLDAYLLVDLSGSFSDDLPVFKAAAPLVISTVQALIPGVRFGLGKFEDYPISPFGDADCGDKPMNAF